MINPVKSEKYIRLRSLGLGPYVMKRLKVCPECGQIVGARTRVCPGCQNKMPQKTLFDFYLKMHADCPYCRTTLAKDAQYCPNCGRKVPQVNDKANSQ